MTTYIFIVTLDLLFTKGAPTVTKKFSLDAQTEIEAWHKIIDKIEEYKGTHPGASPAIIELDDIN